MSFISFLNLWIQHNNKNVISQFTIENKITDADNEYFMSFNSTLNSIFQEIVSNHNPKLYIVVTGDNDTVIDACYLNLKLMQHSKDFQKLIDVSYLELFENDYKRSRCKGIEYNSNRYMNSTY